MPLSRRKFLQQAALAGAGTFMAGGLPAQKPRPSRLTGVQLYSVRDHMKKAPLDTLKKLAAIGYKHVEHANYVDRKFYGYTAAEFRKLLDGLGLSMPSGHTVMRANHWDAAKKEFTDEWKYTIEDAATLGQRFVISPSLPEEMRNTRDALMHSMELFNKSGELCKKAAMQFGYHNHHFEFAEKLDGTTVYDLILQHTEPSLVIHQLDIGNMYNAGAKALDIMNKYPGRFASMHVKDEIKAAEVHNGEEFESTILGAGLIPVKEIIDLGVKNGGTLHFIVEQEAYQGKTPIECMATNLAVMKKWGY